MITAICILSGVCLFEAYIIAVLLVVRKEEHKFNGKVDPIDLVTRERNWREFDD